MRRLLRKLFRLPTWVITITYIDGSVFSFRCKDYTLSSAVSSDSKRVEISAYTFSNTQSLWGGRLMPVLIDLVGIRHITVT